MMKRGRERREREKKDKGRGKREKGEREEGEGGEGKAAKRKHRNIVLGKGKKKKLVYTSNHKEVKLLLLPMCVYTMIEVLIER